MKRTLLPALVIGVLLLSACAAPATTPPPTPSPTPTSPPPVTVTHTVAVTPMPTPTPTQVPSPAPRLAPTPTPTPTRTSTPPSTPSTPFLAVLSSSGFQSMSDLAQLRIIACPKQYIEWFQAVLGAYGMSSRIAVVNIASSENGAALQKGIVNAALVDSSTLDSLSDLIASGKVRLVPLMPAPTPTPTPASTPTPAPPVPKAELTILEHRLVMEGTMSFVIGKVKNTSDHTLAWMDVTILVEYQVEAFGTRVFTQPGGIGPDPPTFKPGEVRDFRVLVQNGTKTYKITSPSTP